MANSNLTSAKKTKNDEFYTQYHDIEKEVLAYLEFNPDVFRDKTLLLPCDDPEWSNFSKFFAQNFGAFGLKKLISTSYAFDSKKYGATYIPSLFESASEKFDREKSTLRGKIFTLSRDASGDRRVDVDDLEWDYLEGDGDFRSEEVKALRDEADIVITNPPFSLFREFLAWVVAAEKQFLLIGNMNAITYKEAFSLIKDNKMWLGATGFNEGMYFKVPEEFIYADTYKFERQHQGEKVNRVPGVCWFTNLDHGRRHQPLQLMSIADNLRFNRNLKGQEDYSRYDNYDAIEVPFTNAIPSDYDGLMGVPISFLDKYNPEQFEIVGSNLTLGVPISEIAEKGSYAQGGPSFYIGNGDGSYRRIYTRLIIKHKKDSTS